MTCSSGSNKALRGGIAQLGERNAGSVEVRSSILLASTTLQLYLQLPQLTSTTLKPAFHPNFESNFSHFRFRLSYIDLPLQNWLVDTYMDTLFVSEF